MSEYKKTALVLGAGGFIGSHMVRRLRSEGYWVRGVDLKYPEFSLSEANEFVQGDLRDVDFVRGVIEFKGEQGNFYNSVPYRISVHLMRSISLLLIWVVQDLYSLVKMMQTLCTTLCLLI
jgi:dTDP-D-glucose 4,6-dehydratase